MWGYSSREVAQILSLSMNDIRACVRSGLIAPARGPRGELRFVFQDLLVLRTARELLANKVPRARVRRALRRLREQLPEGRPLTGVHIAVEDDRVVVRDGDAKWHPESGQVLFDFDVGEVARKVAPLVQAARRPASDRALSAQDFYEWGCDLEDGAPAQAIAAYRRAVELEPAHADALVNLGRLLHHDGDARGAEALYRRALAVRNDDATAAFNLGVALEDLDRAVDAIAAYEWALRIEPDYADAHYNVALLLDAQGQRTAALRHLKAYKSLTGR
jgi:tetratricopeptide (TPR) repeat protein